MKLLVLIALLITGQFCAADDVSRDGSSQEHAIVMHGSTRTFEDDAFRIISQHYPDAERESMFLNVGYDGRTYLTAITFSTKSHGKHTMYFDTTDVH